MSQSVMIKSNKYGINLVLDPNIPFVELLKDVIEKFKASEKFFKNAELAISFEGRKLSEEEENRIIEAITENTTIQILCIVQNGSEQEAVMKQQIEYYQAVQQQFMNANTGSGDFYRGTLRSGQVIESESSVTIIGDVNPGAKIISQGNIVILGPRQRRAPRVARHLSLPRHHLRREQRRKDLYGITQTCSDGTVRIFAKFCVNLQNLSERYNPNSHYFISKWRQRPVAT